MCFIEHIQKLNILYQMKTSWTWTFFFFFFSNLKLTTRNTPNPPPRKRRNGTWNLIMWMHPNKYDISKETKDDEQKLVNGVLHKAYIDRNITYIREGAPIFSLSLSFFFSFFCGVPQFLSHPSKEQNRDQRFPFVFRLPTKPSFFFSQNKRKFNGIIEAYKSLWSLTQSKHAHWVDNF